LFIVALVTLPLLLFQYQHAGFAAFAFSFEPWAGMLNTNPE
jgi:hypothetical protein